MTKHNTPALRFDGFDGEWETHPLNKLGSSYGGLTGKTKNDFGHGAARYITYLDVFEHAVIRDARQLGKTEIDNRQAEVKTGDALFTVSSEVPEEVGMSAVWLGQGQDIYLNSFCFGFRPTAELDSKFLAYVLRSPDFREKMGLLAQGISRFNISKQKAMEVGIGHPTLEEQCAIGDLFTDLDALIEHHRAKLANLQQTKAALMQRMFPQDDADEPELRLDGFSGHWKQSSFGDVVESFKYGVNAAATEYDGVTKYLRITDLDESSGQFGTGLVTSPRAEEKTIRDFLLEEGDMVFARTGATVGRSYLFRKSVGRTVWAGFLIRARFKRNTDPQFVAAYAQTDSYWTYVKLTSQRSGQPGLNSSEYAAMPLATPPSLEEQRAIGEVFSNLDALIAAEANYITQLTQAKTALLQRMFV